MRSGKSVFGFPGVVFGAVLIGFSLSGCEKPKPTIGDQVGSAIDNTIQATDRAVKQSQEATDQAQQQISQDTLNLRNAFKQAVDDHLSDDGDADK